MGDVIRPGGKPWTLLCLTSIGGLRFVPGVEYLKVTLCLLDYDNISDAS